MKRLAPLLAVLLIAACSTPRPTPTRKDAVVDGATTAKNAADAARAAEKADKTGVIVASSTRDAPTTQPDEPTTQPAQPMKTPAKEAEAPVLEVTIVKGTPTMNGEPIAQFDKVAAEAFANDANVVLVIKSAEKVEQATLDELTEAAAKAGIKEFEIEIEIEKPAEEPDKPVVKPKKPQPEGDAKKSK